LGFFSANNLGEFLLTVAIYNGLVDSVETRSTTVKGGS
jgi:hypothetical protein